MAEIPRLGEGRQRSQIKHLMLPYQFTLHLPRGANGAGVPLKLGRTAGGLREQFRFAVAYSVVASEEDGGLTLRRT